MSLHPAHQEASLGQSQLLFTLIYKSLQGIQKFAVVPARQIGHLCGALRGIAHTAGSFSFPWRSESPDSVNAPLNS